MLNYRGVWSLYYNYFCYMCLYSYEFIFCVISVDNVIFQTISQLMILKKLKYNYFSKLYNSDSIQFYCSICFLEVFFFNTWLFHSKRVWSSCYDKSIFFRWKTIGWIFYRREAFYSDKPYAKHISKCFFICRG